VVLKVKKIIAEICQAKRQQRIHPALATEIEIKRELMHKGVELTARLWTRIFTALSEDEGIITHRLLRYNGYELKTAHDADTTETNT
jgi:hypothetical protein